MSMDPYKAEKSEVDDKPTAADITGRHWLAEQRVQDEVARRSKAVEQSALWKTILSITVALGAVFGGYFKIVGDASAASDAGQKIQSQKHDALVEEVRQQNRYTDARLSRIEKLLELQMDHDRIPKSVRPEPISPPQRKDAGK